MTKILNIISISIIVLLVGLTVSEHFFPIAGFELVYEKKFYLAIIYIAIRLRSNYLLKKSASTSK